MPTMGGLKLIVDSMAMVDGAPVVTRRTWRQRLLSLPWRPWMRETTHVPKVPGYFLMRDSVLIHPAALEQLRQFISEDR